MKYLKYLPKTIQIGAHARKRRFLLFPKEIDGCRKWLQLAYWKIAYLGETDRYGKTNFSWITVKWITEEDFDNFEKLYNSKG